MIVLDLSRLLSRAASATPSGIDRVELAYARHVASSEHRYGYAAHNATGGIGLLPMGETAGFVGSLDAMWRDGAPGRHRRRVAARARHLRFSALLGAAPLRAAMRRASERSTYLLVSHQNLDRARAIARLKMISGARFVCLIHDLIPLELPHLTRPRQSLRHRGRLLTAGTFADAIVVNSGATRDAVQNHLGEIAQRMPIVVAPLGADPPCAPQPAVDRRPYFVCIGTIEARKNHRLLLDLWRCLAAEFAERAPRLVLIGRRGFGSDEIAADLAQMRGLVAEHPDLPDAAMAGFLRGARALLMPSLAEGFGLPVVEALALGVPVVCSDLPALRETGSGVPDYIDPADGAGWFQAVVEYTSDSPRRRAQLARLAGWHPPRWSDHFAVVEQLIADLR